MGLLRAVGPSQRLVGSRILVYRRSNTADDLTR